MFLKKNDPVWKACTHLLTKGTPYFRYSKFRNRESSVCLSLVDVASRPLLHHNWVSKYFGSFSPKTVYSCLLLKYRSWKEMCGFRKKKKKRNPEPPLNAFFQGISKYPWNLLWKFDHILVSMRLKLTITCVLGISIWKILIEFMGS